MTKRRRVIKTRINADHQIRREPDEPGVLLVVGSASLSGNWPLQHFQLLSCPTLNDTFHNVNHLIRRHRVDDLLAMIDNYGFILSLPFLRRTLIASARIMTPNGATIAVFYIVDQRSLYVLAPVSDDSVSIYHPQQRGFSGAQ